MRVWVDGDLVAAADARVSVFDRGLRTGEGVFETLRAYGRHVFRCDAHIERAIAGASVLGFDIGDHALLRHAVQATADANLDVLGGADSAVRLTATPGAIDPDSAFPGTPTGPSTLVVTSHPLRGDPDAARAGLRAVTVPWGRELAHVKAVSYLAASQARREAVRRGAHEALLTDGSQVLEGASTNVFAVVGGELVTPPLEGGLLAGVTRGVVLELAAAAGVAVTERPLDVSELADADEALLTATVREVAALVEVDGRPVGDGRPGPLTAHLQDAYHRAVAAEAR